MIIVSRKLYVEQAARNSYLADCHELIELARSSAGCLDFHPSADPVEVDRINVYEQWESVDAVEAFPGSGPVVGSSDADDRGPGVSARTRSPRRVSSE